MSTSRINGNFTRVILLIFHATALGGCLPFIVQNSVISYPPYPVNPAPEKFFIANGYNVSAHSFRDNKEEQFTALVKEVMTSLDTTLEREFNVPVDVEPGLSILPVNTDSCIQALFKKHVATHGVIVTHLDAFFNKTDVIVTETENGKEREALYDIVVNIGYSFRNTKNERFDTVISVRRHHSSRLVLSGLLAAGPNIVKNDADARGGLVANVDSYMGCFVQKPVLRLRRLHVRNEFKEVGRAFKMMNDLDARIALLELSESEDVQTAAKANYNYAVLLERSGDYDKVKPFLVEALRLQPNFSHAKQMLKDYPHQ